MKMSRRGTLMTLTALAVAVHAAFQARLMVRGAAGLVSDGLVRDSGAIPTLDFPVYCAGGSAPLNLIHHHAIDLDVPIGCGGVAVYPGISSSVTRKAWL